MMIVLASWLTTQRCSEWISGESLLDGEKVLNDNNKVDFVVPRLRKSVQRQKS